MPAPEFPDGLHLGQLIYYVSDERILTPGHVAAILLSSPIRINIGALGFKGRHFYVMGVAQGHHDGSHWVVLNKWFHVHTFADHSELWDEVKIPEATSRTPLGSSMI